MRVTRSRPKPRYCNAVSTVACASSPIITTISGAPYSPAASTSQPARCSSRWRAAAMPTAFPSPAPVGSPTLASAGRPSRSSIHSPAISSAAAAAGESACSAPFWFQAVVSRSAAEAAGSAPPITKP